MTFQKGNTLSKGKGRPAGSISLVDILRRKLQENVNGKDYSYAEQLVQSYLDEALEKADLKKDAFDRIDGKPKQSVGVEGTAEDGAIEIRIKMV